MSKNQSSKQGSKKTAKKPPKKQTGSTVNKVEASDLFYAAASFDYSAWLLIKAVEDNMLKRFRSLNPQAVAPDLHLVRCEPLHLSDPVLGNPSMPSLTLFPTLIPTWVLASFALELYFKCLILLETGSSESGHFLVELFNKISPKRQNAIRVRYEDAIRNCRSVQIQIKQTADAGVGDFGRVLGNADNAFVTWRYYYENLRGGPPKNPPTLVEGIVSSTREVILQIQPDWRPMVARIDESNTKVLVSYPPVTATIGSPVRTEQHMDTGQANQPVDDAERDFKEAVTSLFGDVV